MLQPSCCVKTPVVWITEIVILAAACAAVHRHAYATCLCARPVVHMCAACGMAKINPSMQFPGPDIVRGKGLGVD